MESLLSFELRQPATLQEAVRAIAADPGARLLAGGTDLLPNLRRGIEQPPLLVSLARVAGLQDMAFDANGLRLGAGVTLARLACDAALQLHYPAIAQAAAAVAGPAHRSAATLAGNLCQDTRCVYYNQSEWWRAANNYCLKRGGETCHVAPQGARCHAAFSGDLAPALLALGAEVELASTRGSRRLPLAELYRDDGAAHLTLARDELLVRVSVPAPSSTQRSGYRKARTRGAMDFALAGVACALEVQDSVLTELRVALSGTNSLPFVLAGTEALIGQPLDEAGLTQLGKLVQKQVSPMRSTATPSNYRRLVASTLAQRLVRELASDPVKGAAAC